MAEVSGRPAGSGDHRLDVTHLVGYEGFLGPRWMRYIGLLNGLGPSMGEDFVYAELGCGNGLSLLVHAAGHPQAKFIGIDINPHLIDFARRLAAKCGLANVDFLQRDLGDSGLAEELPSLDLVGMYGLYSWVSPEVRAAVHSLLQRKLSPGGVVSLSYAAMPGWSGLAPMREMVRSYNAHSSENSLERARKGLKYLRWLCDQGSQYFQTNPGARARLEVWEKSDLHLVARECFSPERHGYYFHEVERRFTAHGMRFAGTAAAVENYRDLTLSQDALQTLGSVNNREAFEIHRDFLTNRGLRRDVFIKPRIAAVDVESALSNLRFCSLVPPAQFDFKLKVPVGSIALRSPMLERLVPLLEAPLSASELAAKPELSEYHVGDIVGALHRLVLTGQVTVAGPSDPDPPTANFSLCEHQVLSGEDPVLASAVTGMGVRVRLADALLMLALTRTHLDNAVDNAVDWIAENRVALRHAGTLMNRDAIVEQLNQALPRVLRSVREQLAPLGVWSSAIAPAGRPGAGQPARAGPVT